MLARITYTAVDAKPQTHRYVVSFRNHSLDERGVLLEERLKAFFFDALVNFAE